MTTIRTSISHPLQIDVVTPAGYTGRIGMTFCPGKQQADALTGAWERDLKSDIQTIKDWGATTVITLLEPHELDMLGVPDLGKMVVMHGMEWMHLPIQDASVPNGSFEQQWDELGGRIRSRLASGESIVLHCKGGLGRTGMIAARLLVELGEEPQEAIHRVRSSRTGAIETQEQYGYVLNMSDLTNG